MLILHHYRFDWWSFEIMYSFIQFYQFKYSIWSTGFKSLSVVYKVLHWHWLMLLGNKYYTNWIFGCYIFIFQWGCHLLFGVSGGSGGFSEVLEELCSACSAILKWGENCFEIRAI